MGTTLGKKEEVKVSVRTKKVAAVTRAPKKPVTKKATVKKPKEPIALVAKKPTTRAKKAVAQKETPAPSEVVFVPGAASLRLLEKVELYTLWYERHVPLAMSTVAKVGGYAFIFLGTVFAVFSYIDTKNILATPAALVCSEAVCSEVNETDLPVTAPKISFLNSIPTIVEADTDFKINAEQLLTPPTVTLMAIETGSTVVLEPAERLNETEYRFMLPGGRLAAGSYKMVATTEAEGSTYTFVGSTFTIPPKELPAAPVAAVAAEVIEEMTPQSASTTEELPEVEEEAIAEEVETETESTLPEVEEEEELSEEEETLTEESALESEVAVTTSSADAPISISLHTEAGSSYVKVGTGSFTPTRVDIYSQVLAAGQPIYLGTATLVQGEWVFSVSALTLPQTTHYLYASFTEAGKVYQSEAVTYLAVADTESSPATDADLSILVQKIELALLASSVNNENRRRYFDYFATRPEALFPQDEELQFADSELLTTIDATMRADVESLQPLLLRYAAGIQAESTFLTALSSAALTEHYTKLASTIASVIGEPETVPAIHTVLALRYQILKDKIRESEDQIKQDTNNLTAKDSDSDGISDFDEVANFGTSPLLADTDNDGVLDSIELTRASDALLPDLSRVPSLFTNIEDVTFDSVVSINFVGPQVVANKADEPEEFYVRVEGQSVPNSHVYILSYSTGVVGLVKTGSEGDFSYTIERDFAIGEHQVVAVLADSTGAVVASSKPHHFTRTENAFVAAAALSTGSTDSTPSSEDNILLHLLVAAVGVITFGFILLLLSNTLRSRSTHKVKTA